MSKNLDNYPHSRTPDLQKVNFAVCFIDEHNPVPEKRTEYYDNKCADILDGKPTWVVDFKAKDSRYYLFVEGREFGYVVKQDREGVYEIHQWPFGDTRRPTMLIDTFNLGTELENLADAVERLEAIANPPETEVA